MSRIISDQEHKLAIIGCYDLIELMIKTARSHMTGAPGCRPELVDSMFEGIGFQVRRSEKYRWPDPAARAAEAAKQDPALQKLIRRASKPTPIRAAKKAPIRAA